MTETIRNPFRLRPGATGVIVIQTSIDALENLDFFRMLGERAQTDPNVEFEAGDSRVMWNKDVRAETDFARQSFDTLTASGYDIHRVNAGGATGGKMDRFDPSAEAFVAMPRTQRG